jgi:hypothetical protein
VADTSSPSGDYGDRRKLSGSARRVTPSLLFSLALTVIGAAVVSRLHDPSPASRHGGGGAAPGSDPISIG